MTQTQPNTHEALPVFVYGTLRPGNGLSTVWDGYTESVERAILPGATLWGRGAGYPYAVVDDASHQSVVVGDLLTFRPDAYERMINTLDRIEGYHPDWPAGNHYDRVKVLVEVPGRPLAEQVAAAYVYVAGKRTAKEINLLRANPGRDSRLEQIVTGDWNNQDVAEELFSFLVDEFGRW